MAVRMKYYPDDDGNLVSDNIIIGIKSYHVLITELNEVIIVTDTGLTSFGEHDTKALAKKTAKQALIKLGANFVPETRKVKSKPTTRVL